MASMLSMLIKKMNTSKSLLYNVSSIIYHAAKNREIWLIFQKVINKSKISAKPILIIIIFFFSMLTILIQVFGWDQKRVRI